MIKENRKALLEATQTARSALRAIEMQLEAQLEGERAFDNDNLTPQEEINLVAIVDRSVENLKTAEYMVAHKEALRIFSATVVEPNQQ